MQTTEDWRRRDSIAAWEPLTGRSSMRVTERPVRQAWSQTRVGPAAMVVSDPRRRIARTCRSLIAMMKSKHSRDRAEYAFAERIRLWSVHGCFEDRQTHGLKGSIGAFRVNPVAIVDHESVA